VPTGAVEPVKKIYISILLFLSLPNIQMLSLYDSSDPHVSAPLLHPSIVLITLLLNSTHILPRIDLSMIASQRYRNVGGGGGAPCCWKQQKLLLSYHVQRHSFVYCFLLRRNEGLSLPFLFFWKVIDDVFSTETILHRTLARDDQEGFVRRLI
jgi:hypothetical protein